MKPLKYMVLLLCFLLFRPVYALERPGSIVVGTYAYKGLDRESAVQPIADALGTVKQKARVHVYDSPTLLADAFFSREAQIIVPNLAGFAQIAAKQGSHILLFVPNDAGSSYKSSVVMSSGSASFAERLHSDKKNIGMVWADSTSGAILGMDYLLTQVLPGHPLPQDRIVYLGSHSNVLAALLEGRVDIGVLATDVYLTQKNSLPEVWRSNVIPYGPVLCSESISELCSRLQQQVMDNPEVHNQVLQHLKNGWPEFRSATTLVIPEYKTYQAFIAHFEMSIESTEE